MIARPFKGTDEGEMGDRANLLSIDEGRLWETLLASAEIGPGRAGGLRRLALSDADKEMRDLFVAWCEAAGCAVTVDRMGNIFARRAGTDDDLPPVMIGSHLDSQVAGGRYDGILGVLAGLEILRSLNDHGLETRRPIEVVNWSNEEGARFPRRASAMPARRPWAGARSTPISSSTSSRAPCWRPSRSPSAWSPAATGPAACTSISTASAPTAGRPRWTSAATPWSAPPW
jgi:hypothetical protein